MVRKPVMMNMSEGAQSPVKENLWNDKLLVALDDLSEKPKSQIVLTAGLLSIEVLRGPKEVKVFSSDFLEFSHFLTRFSLCRDLVGYAARHAPKTAFERFWMSQSSSYVQLRTQEAKHCCVISCADSVPKDVSRRVAVAELNRFSCSPTKMLLVQRQVLGATAVFSSAPAFTRGSNFLTGMYPKFCLAIGYKLELIELPIFDLKILKWCPERASSSIFSDLDPFSMTKPTGTTQKGAKQCSWMMSRCCFCRTIINLERSVLSLFEVVFITVGVCLSSSHKSQIQAVSIMATT